MEGRCGEGHKQAGEVVTRLPPPLLLFWMGHCDSGGGRYVSGGLFFSRGLVRPLCGSVLSSRHATLHMNVGAALWAGMVHIYPIGLTSFCLGLGLSVSQPGWVLASFLWVRLGVLRPVGLSAWSGLRVYRAGREGGCPEGALAQPGEGGPSSPSPPFLL